MARWDTSIAWQSRLVWVPTSCFGRDLSVCPFKCDGKQLGHSEERWFDTRMQNSASAELFLFLQLIIMDY